MKKIKVNPFRGLRYNPLKIKDFAEVVAPPYDVIDEAYRNKLYERHENNVVKLILTKEEGGQNKYEVAAKHLSDWQKQEVLIRDQTPQFYIYHQTYTLSDGRSLTRKGFIVRRRLESFEEGKIRPHEYTFAGPKADRMQLTKSTLTNLSPIFGIFSDPGLKVLNTLEGFTKSAPLMDLVTDDGNRHQVWSVGDAAVQKNIDELMQETVTFIADGHHRYETALGYRDFKRAENPSASQDAGHEFVMMYLCPMEDKGLVILPTHRVLDSSLNVNVEENLKKLSKEFEVKRFAKDQSEAALKELANVSKDHLAFILSWKDSLALIQIAASQLTAIPALASIKKEVRELDVTVLHKYLLPEIFGVDLHEGDEAKKIHYVKDTQEALQMPNKGEASLSFVLNATKMSQVEAVSNIGERMPHKSTFFYPKLLSGLVFNPLD